VPQTRPLASTRLLKGGGLPSYVRPCAHCVCAPTHAPLVPWSPPPAPSRSAGSGPCHPRRAALYIMHTLGRRGSSWSSGHLAPTPSLAPPAHRAARTVLSKSVPPARRGGLI
jgi:hypothetical protein